MGTDNEYNQAYADDIEREFEGQLLDDSEYEDISGDTPEVSEENLTEEAPDSMDIGAARIVNKDYVKTISSIEYKELKEELEKKTEELKIAREKLNEAKAAGDLSENEAYTHFRGVVSGLESDIINISNEINNSKVVDNNTSNKVIGRGSRVHLTVTDNSGVMPAEDIEVVIVSEGHGGIIDGKVRIPENSEVYRRMADSQSGEFDLTGLDGNNYHYKYSIIRGD